MMPKANDNSEDFDPVKIRFEKCCSALAFRHPWMPRTCKTAQGGSDVQGLAFADLLRLLHQLHSPGYRQSCVVEVCVSPELHAF